MSGQDDAPLVQMRAKLSQLKTEAILNSSCNENQSQSNSLQRCGNNCLLSLALLTDPARHGYGRVICSTTLDIECFILCVHFTITSCTARNLELQQYKFLLWHCSAEQRPELHWRHGHRISGDQTVMFCPFCPHYHKVQMQTDIKFRWYLVHTNSCFKFYLLNFQYMSWSCFSGSISLHTFSKGTSQT